MTLPLSRVRVDLCSANILVHTTCMTGAKLAADSHAFHPGYTCTAFHGVVCASGDLHVAIYVHLPCPPGVLRFIGNVSRTPEGAASLAAVLRLWQVALSGMRS